MLRANFPWGCYVFAKLQNIYNPPVEVIEHVSKKRNTGFICGDVVVALALNQGFVYILGSLETCFTHSAHAMCAHTIHCNLIYSGNSICLLSDSFIKAQIMLI